MGKDLESGVNKSRPVLDAFAITGLVTTIFMLVLIFLVKNKTGSLVGLIGLLGIVGILFGLVGLKSPKFKALAISNLILFAILVLFHMLIGK